MSAISERTESDRPRRARSTAPWVGMVLLALAAPAQAAEELQLLPELPAPIADTIGAPTGWALILLILLFTVLVVPVNQLVFKPIFRVLDERDARIAGTRARAIHLEQETDQVLSRYESQVAAVREEAEQGRRALLESARSDAVGTTSGARVDAEREIERARQEVGAALETARASLRSQSQELARQAAASVLGRPL